MAFLDDTYIFGPMSATILALTYLDTHGPNVGLHLSNKTKLWSRAHPLQPPLNTSKRSFILDTGVEVLGGTVSQDIEYVAN